MVDRRPAGFGRALAAAGEPGRDVAAETARSAGSGGCQHLRQGTNRLELARLDGAFRDSQGEGRFLLAQPLVLGQNQHGPMFFRQTRDGILHPTSFGRFLRVFFGARSLSLPHGLFTKLHFLTSFDLAMMVAAQI